MTPEELITPREQTRAGFVKMALEKNLMAGPFIAEAKALKILASRFKAPRELLDVPELNAGLMAASGLSVKSLAHITDADKRDAILGLIDNFLEPAGDDFPNELVYRYLLTKGDALGGQARNLAGVLGDWKFLRMVLSILKIGGIPYRYRDIESGVWTNQPDEDTGIEKRIKALYWRKGDRDRLLVRNSKLPLIDKSVDLMLFSGTPDDYLRNNRGLFLLNARYLALGELKGGIDPAGSDEHWKTANFALNRIRGSFGAQGLNPPTFFIGAAIETSMAGEICAQIRARVLNKAANLTNDEQLTGICEWLINL
ncbi:MAG: AvaI/BsoBI family type II restriction endonuclease [Pyrinomonadaceae bacterium]